MAGRGAAEGVHGLLTRSAICSAEVMRVFFFADWLTATENSNFRRAAEPNFMTTVREDGVRLALDDAEVFLKWAAPTKDEVTDPDTKASILHAGLDENE